MPTLDSTANEDVIIVKVICDGQELSDGHQISSIKVDKDINRIPSASIELIDGDPVAQDFPLSAKDALVPGSKIEIQAGYRQNAETIYEGVVVRLGIRAAGGGESRLIIECKDPAYRMTLERRNRNFQNKKDSELISALVAEYSDLSVTADSTGSPLELVQHCCSDWDFLLMRAQANGQVVQVDGGNLKVTAPEASGEAIAIAFGVDLIDFDFAIDSANQYPSVKTRSWDPAQQATVEAVIAPVSIGTQGNLSSSQLAAVGKTSDYQLQTPATWDAKTLAAWGTGKQTLSALNRVSGSGRVTGTSMLSVGSVVDLQGTGKRFNSSLFVSGVSHELAQGEWTTEFRCGGVPDPAIESSDVNIPAAAGIASAVPGLQIAKVLKLDGDPAEEQRIQIELPVNQFEHKGVWARQATFYATTDSPSRGALFIPEVGDEVIVGFLDGSASSPIVLGSLYSSKHPPYEAWEADNFKKAIITRSELKLEFDDKKKVITLVTPAGNTVVIDDDNQAITLTDETSNEFKLSPDGISAKSPKDITISADGNIDIAATGDLTLSSVADVNTTGHNITISAEMAFTAKGITRAELTASGQTNIKGAMVMIN